MHKTLSLQSFNYEKLLQITKAHTLCTIDFKNRKVQRITWHFLGLAQKVSDEYSIRQIFVVALCPTIRRLLRS